MHTIRRLILGMTIGLIATGLLLAFVGGARTLSGHGLTVAELGGITTLFVTGLLLGGPYARLFRPRRGGHAENLMSGLLFSLLAWIILALNVYPVLRGQRPVWMVAEVATLLPTLIAVLFQGGFIGVVYGLIHQAFAERLGLVKIAPAAPAITTRVVILGGGYAGVQAAQTLERDLAGDPSVGIWLVSETNYLLHTPMLSEVSAGTVDAQHITPVLRNFFRQVQVVQGVAACIDLDQKVVHLASDVRSPRRLPFDHLVLAVGGTPNFFGNKEIEARAFTFKWLEDAILLRNHVIDMFERADFEQDPDRRRCLLTFVVAGGGFAGVELIGALNDLARGMLPSYPNVLPEELGLVLVHTRARILPELSAGLADYAREKLEERGVEFRLGRRVTGVTGDAVCLGDEVLPAKTLVWATGVKPNPILETLALPLTERGQIEVNAGLAVPERPGLWAAGDCAQVPDLTTGKFAPPTAQHAVREGKVVGRNIAAAIKDRPFHTFRYESLGSLAALGHQLAVAEIMGYRFSGFLAWLLWRGVYLSKLPTLDRRVRVGLDWLLDIFFPPDIARTVDFSRSDRDKLSPHHK